jgi:DNA-binding GntR family transcriptional regulator
VQNAATPRSAAMTTPSAGRATLGTTAYTVIKRAIVRCDLAPGSHVSESEIAEQFGLGRAAVRTALSRLSQERLLHAIPRRGHLIAPITLVDVRDVFDTRRLLEPATAARAAQSSDADGTQRLRDLETACVSARYDPNSRSDIERFLRANTALHMGIAELANNRRTVGMLLGLFEASERFFHLGLRVTDRNDEMYHEHHDLIDAIAAHDSSRARDTALAQIETSQEMVMRAILESPALTNANAYVARSALSASSG